VTELELGHSLEALAPATRSLENVLRQAVSAGPGLRLISAVSVNGGQLPGNGKTYGHVSINGGPAILVPILAGAIPYYNDGGAGLQSYPGLTVYLLASEGALLAIGYIDTLESLFAVDERGTDADDT
jgi:hypothetical protein